MARIESVAIGGFFRAPLTVVDLVLQHLQAQGPISIVDPCAGEGEAAFHLREHLGKGHLYLVEMETTRATTIEAKKKWGDKFAAGDFFHLFSEVGYHRVPGDFLWLNPPYDTDRDVGRLEERFLVRATPLVRVGGILAFVVPYYALSASAKTLAANYTDLQCFRFPEPEWDSYKQVVLFGQRVATLQDEFIPPASIETVRRWASDPSAIPTLGEVTDQIVVQAGGGFESWKVAPLDLSALAADYDPWQSDKGPVPGIAPPADASEMSVRRYPVASRPRAVHLAAALAAGVFNGLRVEPDDQSRGLPSLLVKGVFDKEFRRVEDRLDKNGKKVAEVQVQQPKLAVTILDLSTGLFHTVSQTGESSGEVSVDKLTMRDLLDCYGRSLMRGLLDACPVLHDPSNDPDPIPMPELGRPLFPAQASAVRTILKLRKAHPDRGIIILGEIGSGKSQVTLAALKALGACRTLILCPPHLLDSWAEQIGVVLPEATIYRLSSIPDVQRFGDHQDGIGIGLLSREKAKLGHGWGSVTVPRCPACSADLPTAAKDFAKSRSRCEAVTLRPANRWARWLVRALPQVLPFIPDHPSGRAIQGRFFAEQVKRWQDDKRPFTGVPTDLIEELVGLLRPGTDDGDLRVWLAWLLPSLAERLAAGIGKLPFNEERRPCDVLLALDDPGQAFAAMTEREDAEKASSPYGHGSFGYSASRAREDHARVHQGEQVHGFDVVTVDGELVRKGAKRGSVEALGRCLDAVLTRATFSRSTCGEPLYFAEPPTRYPLASWIQKRAPKCYDMLVCDEAHEFASRDSAQTSAAQQLLERRDVPVLLLTGSLLNGYAESVYMNMYGISPEFRRQYGRDQVSSFIDRYGYWKQVVQDKDTEGKIIEYGSQSNRVIRSVRKAGVAPGILPVFQLEHLLPLAVTLQKEDLQIAIPPRTDVRTDIQADGALLANYRRLLATLTAEIKRTRFTPGLGGKLWGAMARLPSYLDLACTGNTDDGSFEIRWPEGVPSVGGQLVASAPLLDPSTRLPKEQWVVDRIASEVAEGRNVLVLCWHTRLVERMASIIGAAGFKTVVLDAAKVPTATRQEWISKNVVKPKAQVLVVNPVCVQTGLNNLVHFATEVWLENPMCNAIVYRQACGRIDRIGQTLPTRIVMPVYSNTAQDQQHRLLLHKVGVSASVDGLDAEEALRAAGVVDSDFMGFSVGRKLYEMLMSEDG